MLNNLRHNSAVLHTAHHFSLTGGVCLLSELCFGTCEKLRQLSTSEVINSAEALKGRGAAAEVTWGNLFIAVTHIKPTASSECRVRSWCAAYMLMCRNRFEPQDKIKDRVCLFLFYVEL